MLRIDHGPNRISKYSPRDGVSEDVKRKAEYYEKLAEENEFSEESVRIIKHTGRVAVSAAELNPGEHAVQGELFPESWATGQ